MAKRLLSLTMSPDAAAVSDTCAPNVHVRRPGAVRMHVACPNPARSDNHDIRMPGMYANRSCGICVPIPHSSPVVFN